MNVSVRLFFLFLVVLNGYPVRASPAAELPVTPLFNEINLAWYTDYFIDSSARLTYPALLARPHAFQAVSGRYVNFKTCPYPVWLRIRLRNASNQPLDLSVVTKGIDTLRYFWLPNDRLVKQGITGCHRPPAWREQPSDLLSVSLSLPALAQGTLLLRAWNEDYPLSVYPFQLIQQRDLSRYIGRNDFFKHVYVGGMLVILFFSVAMALFFRERMYGYYCACVVSSLLLMLFYHEYHYLLMDQSPRWVRNKNIFGFLSTILTPCYLLFAREFLAYGYDPKNRFTNLITGLATFWLTSSLLVFVLGISFYEWRYFFHLNMALATSLTLLLLYRSLRSGYRPARLFLAATVPVFLAGSAEAFSAAHNIPVQLLHQTYYQTTLLEMFLITLGLGWRFKLIQDEKTELQKNMQTTEITAQEVERTRIGRDLHDRLGGLISALKSSLDYLVRGKPNAETSAVFEKIDLLAEETRLVSHNLMASSLGTLGLVALLKNVYESLDSPKVSVQASGFEGPLDPDLERTLYSIIQECMNNVLRHAEASEVSIQLLLLHDQLKVVVEDDGKGFNLSETGRNGRGLDNIALRVKNHLRGSLSVDSSPGSGTVIIVKKPLN